MDEKAETNRVYCWNIHNRHNHRTINSMLSLEPAVRFERLKPLIGEGDSLFNINRVIEAKKMFEVCVVCLIACREEMHDIISGSTVDVDSFLVEAFQCLYQCCEHLGFWSDCIDVCDYVLNNLSGRSILNLRRRAKVAFRWTLKLQH